MIITQKKPFEEILGNLKGVKKVALVGCGSCATNCKTGGEEELNEMEELLKEQGIEVVGKLIPDECCQKLLVKKEIKALKDCGAEVILGMACGDGVQTVAANCKLPVYPANNTMFLGQVERVGIYNEACKMCGDCMLDKTAGICPITKCAKSLVNGPCGGQTNGKCEVNPENDCAWIKIYERLCEIGEESKFFEVNDDKNHTVNVYPSKINLKEGK